ncbi:MAG: NfeD family protein, partial [Myxococcota bacterium]
GLLLFDVEGMDLRVDPALLAGVGLVAAAVAVGVAALVARAQRLRVVTGVEGLLGEEGEVLVGGRDGGRVRVSGEDWRARWRGALEPGAEVRVVAVHGLSLDVEPTDGGGAT